MGSNESIVYGDRHGSVYEDAKAHPGGEEGLFKTFFPNGMIVRSWPDLGHVAIGVQRYDEHGNPIQTFDGSDEQWGSLWADLNRDGCNRLIAGLRLHRDRAFGKDE